MSSKQELCCPKVFIFFRFAVTAAFLSQRQERFLLRLSMHEIRESTRGVHTPRSYQQVTVRRGAWLSLGTRIGLVTASNDHRVLRLTGSLPLLQKTLAGVVMSVGSFFVFP